MDKLQLQCIYQDLPLDIKKEILQFIGEEQYVKNSIEDWKDCITTWKGLGYQDFKNLRILDLSGFKLTELPTNLPNHIEILNNRSNTIRANFNGIFNIITLYDEPV